MCPRRDGDTDGCVDAHVPGAAPGASPWPDAVRELGFRARIAIALGVVGVLLLAVVGVLVASLEQYRTPSGLREHTNSIRQAATIEKLALDLETGARGFVITGDPQFLEPWTTARRQLPRAVRQLEQTADPDSTQGARRLGSAALAYLRDWAVPVVVQARTDPDGAAARIATAGGKRRVDVLRGHVRDFTAEETEEVEAIRRQTDRQGTTALYVGISGLTATVLLIVLFGVYLSRVVVRPVRRLAGATEQLAAGDLSARVPESGSGDELGRLAETFNTMVASLETSRDALEAQNAELEAQQAELHTAVEQVGEQRDRVIALNRHSQRLAAESESQPLAASILAALVDAARAGRGAVYAAITPRDDSLTLVASRGVEEAGLERALHPRDARLASWGDDVPRYELRLPLVHAGRMLGVVMLGDDEPFSQTTLPLLAVMADQSAVALSNTRALADARDEASIRRAVLDATPDGICLTDLRGNVLLANTPMVELAGALGLPLEGTVFEQLLSAADRMTDPDAYRRGMAAMAADPDGQFEQEYTVAESNRSFLGYVGPVRDAAGTTGGRVFVLRETTAERQAERLKDELVATVSHELRTPLTSIIGYLELVLGEEDGALAPAQQRFLQIVDRNARRLLDVVGDLLFVAQVEAGRLALDLDPLDLAQLVDDAAETARPHAAATDVELHVDAERRLVVLGDRIRLAQLLANLVSNAVKFTPSGGRVDVNVRVEAGRAVLEVADTGIGIPEDEQEQMFQRFFRSSSATAHAIQGTGLGLVIAKAIAEAHAGSISFTSEPGVGTTFRVELPVHAREEKEVQVA
jgi:signal transduction histidine kinase